MFCRKAGIVKLELTRPMLEFVFHCVEMRTPAAYSLAEAVVDKIEYNAKVSAEELLVKDGLSECFFRMLSFMLKCSCKARSATQQSEHSLNANVMQHNSLNTVQI